MRRWGIAVLDSDDLHHAAAREGLAERVSERDSFVLPASAYAESLVGAFRQGEAAVATVDAFISAIPAAVEPATRDTARSAAKLRALHGGRLRLSDAFVVATALDLGADRIVTADRDWPDVGIPVVVLRTPARD